MLKSITFIRLAVIGLLACGSAARLEAQKSNLPVSRLPSPQIAAAKSAFIMNAGSENSSTATPQEQIFFTGGPDRAYNEVYAAVKNQGRFRLLSAPSGADLIIEVQYVRHYPVLFTPSDDEKEVCERRKHCEGSVTCRCGDSSTLYVPQLDVIVRDAETHAVLREFARLIETSNMKGGRNQGDRQQALDRNFDDAINGIIDDLGDLAGGSRTPAPVYFSNTRVAPTPNQITAARKVWIARARADSGRVDTMDMDTPGSDLTYNTFYALIKNGGRFEIADSPAAADLILQLSTVTNEWISPLYAERRINLTVADPRTGTGLWTLMEDVAKALLPANIRRNQQQTVATVAYNLTGLAGRLTPATIPGKLDMAPPPVLMSAGQKVFIANAAGRIRGAKPGGNDRMYNDFYTSMKRLGRFELVSSPGAADLIFELASDDGHLSLHVVDNRTRTALLDLAATDQAHSSKKSDSKDFSETMAALLAQAERAAHRSSEKDTLPEGAAHAPPQLAAAKRVFAAFPLARWDASGEDTDELYSGTVAALKRWGRFEIASTPFEADIIADLTIESITGTNIRLTFRDPKTRAVLGTVSEQLAVPFLIGHLKKDIPRTVDALMNHAREMVGEQIAVQQ